MGYILLSKAPTRAGLGSKCWSEYHTWMRAIMFVLYIADLIFLEIPVVRVKKITA